MQAHSAYLVATIAEVEICWSLFPMERLDLSPHPSKVVSSVQLLYSKKELGALSIVDREGDLQSRRFCEMDVNRQNLHELQEV